MNRSVTALRILLVEDEPALADAFRRFLEHAGHTVAVARDAIAALRTHRARPVHVALVDLALPGSDGLGLLRESQRDAAPPACLVLSGVATVDSAVESMRLGAADFIAKPYQFADVLARAEAAWARRTPRYRHTPPPDAALPPVLRSAVPEMRAAVRAAQEAAATDDPVLIVGEIGCGQPELARLIHSLSPRAERPLVEASCELLTTRGAGELLGQDNGLRRSARQAPLVSMAAGGTLVLDGLESLDRGAQAALGAAFARGKTLHAIGAPATEMCTRLVATSVLPLRSAVRAGAIDPLLARALSARVIVLPPRREREADIPAIAAALVREFGGVRPPTLADDAVSVLTQRAWSCNLVELRAVVERAVSLASGGVIHAKTLLGPGDAELVAPVAHAGLSLAEVEREHIGAVLARVGWHQGKAAAALGISAKTLYRKIREFGFRRPDGSPGG
ncbi:MAG: sigma-54-dependent Fis family transcriptional regulator [Gemmatimonadetes bacterium]|nr:sigma-54-dependent Fis family transcriptional regulator [Gemmatimonadota bacterium]